MVHIVLLANVDTVIDIEAVFNATVCSMRIGCEDDNRMVCGGPVALFSPEGSEFWLLYCPCMVALNICEYFVVGVCCLKLCFWKTAYDYADLGLYTLSPLNDGPVYIPQFLCLFWCVTLEPYIVLC